MPFRPMHKRKVNKTAGQAVVIQRITANNNLYANIRGLRSSKTTLQLWQRTISIQQNTTLPPTSSKVCNKKNEGKQNATGLQ